MTGSSYSGDVFDRYGSDILSNDPHQRRRPQVETQTADYGLVIEEAASGWCGAITRVEKSGGMHLVQLEDRHGKVRSFPLGPGFLLEGKPVTLIPPKPARARDERSITGRDLTNSGSRAVATMPRRVARASRIWVEGLHDAELIEHVWGDDLRIEGVVVEVLDGVDNLAQALTAFAPTPQSRVGVLVDHLLPGSKESRIAAAVTKQFGAEAIQVAGHPFVDIWQAVKPTRVGLQQWPVIPRDTDIKVGSLRALGLPANDQADIARGWKLILSRVRDFRDLEPQLLAPVEMLIDFVTAPGTK